MLGNNALSKLYAKTFTQVAQAVTEHDYDKLRKIRDDLTTWLPSAISWKIWEAAYEALRQ